MFKKLQNPIVGVILFVFSISINAGIIVIANKKLPINHFSDHSLRKMYSGIPVDIEGINIVPLDLDLNTQVAHQFYRYILDVNVYEISKIRSTNIFTGGSTRILTVKNPYEAINLVSSHRRFVAYIPSELMHALPSNVEVVNQISFGDSADIIGVKKSNVMQIQQKSPSIRREKASIKPKVSATPSSEISENNTLDDEEVQIKSNQEIAKKNSEISNRLHKIKEMDKKITKLEKIKVNKLEKAVLKDKLLQKCRNGCSEDDLNQLSALLVS